jgi:hypothetical protein
MLVAAGCARAEPGLLVGVHDDQIKWRSEPKAILASVHSLGLDAMRVTLAWRSGRRNLTVRHHHEIRRVLVAHRRGVRIVLGVYGHAEDAPSTARAREDYCRFVRNVVLRYSEIRDVVIWNEANSDTFWSPRAEAADAYAALLARCWDLLHASVVGVNVITTTAASHDPIGFVGAVASGLPGERPVSSPFDTVGHNPYPLYPGEPPTTTHDVYVGQGDHARLVAALDVAFAATAQPPSPVWYLEDGFQTAVAPSRRLLYAGRESVIGAVSGASQAAQLGTALRLAYCQPRVQAFFNFLLVDEPALGRWQSGLLWADWKRKPAFAAYRAAIAEVRAGTVACEPADALGREDVAPGNAFRYTPRPETTRSTSSRRRRRFTPSPAPELVWP